jgi:NADPH-dependent curcumin reductase CurA
MITSREIHLKKRPQGLPTQHCFELASVELPAIQEGELLVKNLWMSVDPYMRGRMDDAESYIAPFALGKPMEGGAIGRVVSSKNPQFAVGDHVQSMFGWREYFVFPAAGIESAEFGGLQKVDDALVPIQAYLGVAGMPGMTAYAGLMLVAQAKPGETVFVSGAAGAVGSMVCQIAKIHGCRVVGSAGSEQKVAWLKETAGVDAAFNYKKIASISDALDVACPEGIDVYFENVGGEHLRAAIQRMKTGGRIAICGLISEYNVPTGKDAHGLFTQILGNSLTVRGFIVTEFWDRYPQFLKSLAGWIRDGRIKWEETVFDGIEKAPEAFLGLFAGRNLGKMLVKLAND